MYLDESFTSQERWLITRMIYGGQTDKYDYHKVHGSAFNVSIDLMFCFYRLVLMKESYQKFCYRFYLLFLLCYLL